MKSHRQIHGRYDVRRDRRAPSAAASISCTGSTPSSNTPANTTSTSSSTSATTSEGLTPPPGLTARRGTSFTVRGRLLTSGSRGLPADSIVDRCGHAFACPVFLNRYPPVHQDFLNLSSEKTSREVGFRSHIGFGFCFGRPQAEACATGALLKRQVDQEEYLADEEERHGAD